MTADELTLCVLVDSFGQLVPYYGRYVLEDDDDIAEALEAMPDADAFEVTLTIGGVYMRGAVSDSEARKEAGDERKYEDTYAGER